MVFRSKNEEKKRVNVYISNRTANILKAYHEAKTGEKDNLSGALTYIAHEFKKRKKTH